MVANDYWELRSVIDDLVKIELECDLLICHVQRTRLCTTAGAISPTQLGWSNWAIMCIRLHVVVGNSMQKKIHILKFA